MKIEVGKSYRTRVGEYAIVCSEENGQTMYPLNGLISGEACCWDRDGQYIGGRHKSSHDLIAPWGDKPADEVSGVITERQRTHGDFSVNASVSQQIKSALRSGVGWATMTDRQREACDHIAGKFGRIVAGDAGYADHWVDIQGYARLAAENRD